MRLTEHARRVLLDELERFARIDGQVDGAFFQRCVENLVQVAR